MKILHVSDLHSTATWFDHIVIDLKKHTMAHNSAELSRITPTKLNFTP